MRVPLRRGVSMIIAQHGFIYKSLSPNGIQVIAKREKARHAYSSSSPEGQELGKEAYMSINEKSIVGESFEDLSAADMAMLTGRNDDGVAPASLSFAVSVLSVSFSACSATVVTRLASCGNCK